MYHARFKNTHYEAGFHWGQLIKSHGTRISDQPTFQITEDRKAFVNGCIPVYEKFYPEILEEIKGISDAQQIPYPDLCAFLLSMYCFELSNHCTCFAFQDDDCIILGRNSDFLTALEHLYMNCLYQLDNAIPFNGNTTAFVQMEDGINAYGLAAGLTFVYPKVRGYGFNAGMLVRYILEKCRTTQEALSFLKAVPIASQQTITILDAMGNMAVAECNPYAVEIIYPKETGRFVVAANNFTSPKMAPFKNGPAIDDWRSSERYHTAYQALLSQNNRFSLELAQDILSGKLGFMCQYDRKTGADTVWSVIYDVKNQKIYRAEGNPSRKRFVEDLRFDFLNHSM